MHTLVLKGQHQAERLFLKDQFPISSNGRFLQRVAPCEISREATFLLLLIRPTAAVQRPP